MKGRHHNYSNVKPVRQTGDSTGGPTQPLSKPMDKPPKQYTSNESVPQDNFHAEAPPSQVDNPGSFAKSFLGHLPKR